MSGVGSESRETGYPWMGKLGKKIGESRGVEEVSPADENDTCPDGSWAGPLGKPQEVSPAPTPRKCICGHGLTAHGLGNGMCLVVGCKCAQMREDKFAEGGESAESEPNKATIPAQVGELIAPPLRNEPSAISNESSLGELKAALRSIVEGAMTAELDTRCHICRPSDEFRHEESCPILQAERVLARVSEGSGA
jgi:hypothetical protein